MDQSVAPPSLHQSLNTFKPLFTSLSPIPLATLTGVYRAELAGPWWIRQMAPSTLGLAGLGNWWGKQFDGKGSGVNLVQRHGHLQETLPMVVEERPSLLDDKPCLAIRYQAGARFPWPHVVDELRRLDKTRLLGLTVADVPLLRQVSFPFLLHHTTQP